MHVTLAHWQTKPSRVFLTQGSWASTATHCLSYLVRRYHRARTFKITSILTSLPQLHRPEAKCMHLPGRTSSRPEKRRRHVCWQVCTRNRCSRGNCERRNWSGFPKFSVRQALLRPVCLITILNLYVDLPLLILDTTGLTHPLMQQYCLPAMADSILSG